MSNFRKYNIYQTLYAIGFLFCSGSLIQTFLIKVGFTDGQVYLYNSLIQMAQIIMMIIMIFVADKIKNVKRVIAVGYLSLVVATVVFLIGSLNPSIEKRPYTIAVFVTSVLSYFGTGFYGILVYRLPYKIIDMKDYGRMLGVTSIIYGPIVFGLSVLHAFLVGKFDYYQTMAWFFILSVICFVLTSIVCFSLRETNGEEHSAKNKDFVAVLKNKYTYVLLVPNFTRGIASGIVGLITVIAITKGVADTTNSSVINIAIRIAAFVSHVVYVLVCKKMRSSTVLLSAAILFCVALPFSLIGNFYAFTFVFLAAYFGISIIDTVIPVIVTEIIPEKEIGAYTSIRMLVFTGGSAVAGLIIMPIADIVGYTGLLVFASVMQAICCVTYFIAAKTAAFMGMR